MREKVGKSDGSSRMNSGSDNYPKLCIQNYHQMEPEICLLIPPLILESGGRENKKMNITLKVMWFLTLVGNLISNGTTEE